MSNRSPQRSRTIRNFVLVGAAVGFFLGLVTRAVNGQWYGTIFFTCVGAAIAGATALLSKTPYDYD